MTWPSPTEQTPDRPVEHLDADVVELLALLALNGEEPASASERDTPSQDAAPPNEAMVASDTAETAHLSSCAHCQDVWQARVTDLRTSREEVGRLVDETFGDETLAQQRASILARLSARRDGGRVLAFPMRDARPAGRERPALRWLAGAAAAGLLIGVVAGQQLNHVRGLNPVLITHIFGPGHEAANRFSSRVASWRPETAGTVHILPVHAHDEAFLSEMETALNYRGVAELRALDDLTPRTTTIAARSPR